MLVFLLIILSSLNFDLNFRNTIGLTFQSKKPLTLTFKFKNKLSVAHINWQNNKMNVIYAAQILSSSTGDALELCKQINKQMLQQNTAVQ